MHLLNIEKQILAVQNSGFRQLLYVQKETPGSGMQKPVDKFLLI
jgi:hypothetical protein